jgi:hypothetical protein
MIISPEPEIQAAPGKAQGRRTERLMLPVPLRVVSYGGSAGGFTEDTHTQMLNRDGALIVLEHRVAPDETLHIINLQNHQEADFRVVGLARQEEGGHAQWGVECLDRDRNFWGIDFPPPMQVNDPNAGALIRCQGCGKQSFLVLSLADVSILDTNGSLEKLCEACGELSSWTYVEEPGLPKLFTPLDAAAAAPAPAEDHPIATTSPPRAASSDPWADEPFLERHIGWDGKSERRLHRRLTLKLPVLIRNQEGQTEIGRTENISKGGLGVGLVMALAIGERITVVCPYSGSSNEITQAAEVMRRISLYGGQRWFYGLHYLV